MTSTALHTYAKFTAAAAFILIMAGGLVTSTGSSMAVPDWPLAFGKFFPPMIGGVLFEHGHRMIAGVVAMMTFILAIWVWLKETGAWVRGLAAAAATGIILQALLGGLTVLMRLPPLVSIAHACLGQTVFCLLVAVAQATSPWYLGGMSLPHTVGLKVTGMIAVFVIYLQLFWGAMVRHPGLAISSIPMTGEYFYRVIFLHMGWAAMVFIAAVALVIKSFRPKTISALRWPAILIISLVPLQVALGFIALKIKFSSGLEYGFSSSAALTTAHVAMGALILATAVVWTMRAYKIG